MARGATTDLTMRHLSGVWRVRAIRTHASVASKVLSMSMTLNFLPPGINLYHPYSNRAAARDVIRAWFSGFTRPFAWQRTN